MTLLVATDLSIGYGARVIASGIDLTLAPGTVTCLLGPNGVGKTTLFKSLMGFLPLLGGQLSIGGKAHQRLTRRNYATLVAYVPQAQPQPFAHRVIDLVLMGRTSHLGLFDTPRRDDVRIAEAALSTLGIADLAQTEITRISGGQLQLVLIARALAQQSAILVMDEPTASLDLANTLRVLDHVAQLAAGGLAILLATHDPVQALTHADQVVLLSRGGTCHVGTPRDVLTAALLSETYGVDLCIETTASGRQVILPRRDARVPGA